MGSRQYLILTDGMTLSEQKELRTNALAAGIQRCFEKGIGVWDKKEIPTPDPEHPNRPDFNATKAYLLRGGWPKSLDVREFQPNLDAGTGAVLDQWLTAALAAPVGTLYSCFGAVIGTPAIALRANKLVVFYKVSVPVAAFPVSRLVFRNNAAGNFLAQFDLEPMIAQQTPEGYFSEPFVVDPNMTFAIQVMNSAVAAAIKVVLGNFLFEPSGQTNA